MSTSALLNGFLREQNSNELVDIFIPGESGSALTEALNVTLVNKKTRTLGDDERLRGYVTQMAAALSKGRIGRGLKKFIDNLVTISWSPQETGAGKMEISFLNGISANEADLPDAFVLRRDSLTSQSISAFLALFSTVPINRRPKVIFDSETRYYECLDLLAYAKSGARVFVDGQGGLSEICLENRSADEDTFLSFYEANALSACAAAKLPSPNDGDSEGDIRENVVKTYLQVQAKKRLGKKFDALEQVLSMQTFLVDRMPKLNELERKWSEQALFFFYLDNAYIDETASAAIERARAIANRQNDDRLIAHTQRMINLTSGINAFSSHELKSATDTFSQKGDPLGYLFCLNNRMVNDSHLDETPLDRSLTNELVEFGFRTTPYSDRLSSVCSTAGVNALLLTDIATAVSLFEKGENASGLRLHHFTASVNRLIAQYVSDGTVSDDDVHNLARSIWKANMPRGLDYHHTYLLGNLAKLASNHIIRKDIHEILISERYMPYSDDNVRDGRVLEFLIPYFNSITDGQRYKGHRGFFFEQYGLLPINHFIWS